MRKLVLLSIILFPLLGFGQSLEINEKDYFSMQGLDVTFFSDFYPEGHQSGISIIQHGNRVAANGDLRLEPSPGQWSAVPSGAKPVINRENKSMYKNLWFPDTSKNKKGFNPIEYPDLQLYYTVSVNAIDGNSFKVTVDLAEALPEEWIGKVGFNLELFPGDLFGKSFLIDEDFGIFPTQPSGDMDFYSNEPLTEPFASGYSLTIAPEEKLQSILIRSTGQKLELWDGRSNHNNGWFIVRSTVPSGATKSAIEWIITPNVVPNWKYKPVIQVSQIGYHPRQKKIAILEMDARDEAVDLFTLYKITKQGETIVKAEIPEEWGDFLRYNYAKFDFTEINSPGMYRLKYGSTESHVFQISESVYSRYVWQPTLEYFLPIQMCHMRVNEKYRVWHDLCHVDDALMSPLNHNHFDGYKQGESTLTSYDSGDAVPGLDGGGWHDAGDYDLRIESQIKTIWMLALMIEEFDLDYDATLIDQKNKLVEIHVPDGKNDAIQQIEHGLLSVLGAYRSMGRLYRGIIASDLRQYVMLGDAASMTDNQVNQSRYDSENPDDRWVFTEQNPSRELGVAAGLAAASRVLKLSNPELSDECLEVALYLWTEASKSDGNFSEKIVALSELILTIQDEGLIRQFLSMKKEILADMARSGWAVGHVIHKIEDKTFRKEVEKTVAEYQIKLQKQQAADSPYGVPYKPNIWGAGWNIQSFGVEQYFFHKGWPGITTSDFYENSLHFILGVHPGSNNSSFASGVGARSVTTAYGVNRAEWSFIPGGVASGTALIRPDLPELKIWPYFWQQTEYVIGGGATNFMFLVLAADKLNR